MERLIDADEAYKVLTDYYHQRTEIQHKALKEAIGRVPSVDADPVKHGHWEKDSTCSVCGKRVVKKIVIGGETLWEDEYDYCPHCGAKMGIDEK